MLDIANCNAHPFYGPIFPYVPFPYSSVSSVGYRYYIYCAHSSPPVSWPGGTPFFHNDLTFTASSRVAGEKEAEERRGEERPAFDAPLVRWLDCTYAARAPTVARHQLAGGVDEL